MGGAGPSAPALPHQEAGQSLLCASLLVDVVWGGHVSRELRLFWNAGPSWLVWLPGPCVTLLALLETRLQIRVAGRTDIVLGLGPKPSGCMSVCQRLREGIWLSGKQGSPLLSPMVDLRCPWLALCI